MSSFNKYSEYYDLLYEDKNYPAEVDYVEKLIKTYSTIETNTILNLGCGTGKHDAIFGQKKYKVTGVDMSETMIEMANKNNKNSICTFVVGDARTIRLKKKFDAIISLFHVASYQTTNDDLFDYFKTAFEHLNEGGVFIFDFWYGPAVLTDLPKVRVKRFENELFSITRISEPTMFANENRVKVNFEFIIESKKTSLAENITEEHNMRYLFFPEMTLMLSNSGFLIQKSLEWLSFDKPMSYKNWNGIIICQKTSK